MPLQRKHVLVAFLLPFVFRIALEIYSGPYPLGFDTMAYHIPRITGFEQLTLGELYGWAPLHFLIANGLNSPIGDPTMTMKILAASLHGLLGLSIYLWCGKSFGSKNGALFAAMATSFYFPVLRLTWDLQRNVLALALAFLTLWLVDKKSNLSAITGGLTALSHQLVAPLLGIILFFKSGENKRALHSLAVTSAVWLSILLVAWGPEIGSRMSEAALSSPGIPFPTSLKALELFLYLSIPILPFLVFRGGIRKRKETSIFLLSCLILSLLPGFISYRFAMMACIPLVLLASSFAFDRGWKMSLGLGIVIAVFAASYSLMPAHNPGPYYRPPIMWDGSFKYAVPTSMMQSTIPQEEVLHARELVQMARERMNDGGRIIVNRIFLSYVILEGVSKERVIFTGTESSWSSENPFGELDGPIYTIWWVPGEGWHGTESPPKNFHVIETRGRLALYELIPLCFRST
jgi:hypothetical protein